jgi:hypothetical protein
LLALIAATVSYLHMHMLVLHGQPDGRHERWGRLVKRAGLAREFAGREPDLRRVGDEATASADR